MQLLMLVNILLPVDLAEDDFREDIVSAVVDFDYRRMLQVLRTVDGFSYITFSDGRPNMKVMISFEDMIGIIESQEKGNVIDDTYKEEVRSYAKDNYKHTWQIKKNDRRGGDEGVYS